MNIRGLLTISDLTSDVELAVAGVKREEFTHRMRLVAQMEEYFTYSQEAKTFPMVFLRKFPTQSPVEKTHRRVSHVNDHYRCISSCPS